MSSRGSLHESVETVLRALSHELRTPLSVVSNELHYLASVVDPNQVEKGIRRCQDISKSLSKLTNQFAPLGDPSDRVVEEFIQQLFPEAEGIQETSTSILLYPEFPEAVRVSSDLIAREAGEVECRWDAKDRMIVLHSSLSSEQKFELPTLTSFARSVLEVSEIGAVWADGVFAQQGAKVRIVSGMSSREIQVTL